MTSMKESQTQRVLIQEDPLSYLPCSRILGYRKGQVIYDKDNPSVNMYLVIDGKVKIVRQTDSGLQVMIDICMPDEFFGESAICYSPNPVEQATALEGVKLMSWSVGEIEDQILKQPRLGVALLQMLTRRNLDFAARVESFSADDIPRRIARALLYLSARQGAEADEDGSVVMTALTHDMLAQFVGTSRELVTSRMNWLRREGYITYSRKQIALRRSLRKWLSGEKALTAAS